MDRVLGYEPRGRGFESCRARHPCIKKVCFLRGTGLFYCPSRIACLKGKGQRAKGKKTVQNGENPERGRSSPERGAVQSSACHVHPLPRSPLRTCRTRQAGRQNPGPRWLQAPPVRSCTPLPNGISLQAGPGRVLLTLPCHFARSARAVQGRPSLFVQGAADGNLGAPSATRTPRRHASGISAVTDG